MKATHVLIRFMVTSIATFSGLHYFGSSYESVLLSIADWLIHGLNLGARLIHDSNDQLSVVMFLKGEPSQFKITGFDWIYAGQATAVGAVLCTYAPTGRKIFWMTNACVMMAIIHTALLVLIVSEVSRHISGAHDGIAAFGAIVFKLYRIGVPVLMAGMWVYCSREALYVARVVHYSKPLHEADNVKPVSWILGGLVRENVAELQRGVLALVWGRKSAIFNFLSRV
tara:strand:+ start:1108 stop:1785 length:678 start_codon:yes stop_codon:yes gene_type:complete